MTKRSIISQVLTRTHVLLTAPYCITSYEAAKQTVCEHLRLLSNVVPLWPTVEDTSTNPTNVRALPYPFKLHYLLPNCNLYSPTAVSTPQLQFLLVNCSFYSSTAISTLLLQYSIANLLFSEGKSVFNFYNIFKCFK